MSVYFIEAVDLDLVKIGYTEHLAVRFEVLRHSSLVELRLLNVIEGGLREEKALHKKFAEHRAHLEWFELTPLRAFIEELPTKELRRPRSVKEMREVGSFAAQLYASAKTPEEKSCIKETWREWRKGDLLLENSTPSTPRETLLKLFD